jgi:hypothetical protein
VNVNMNMNLSMTLGGSAYFYAPPGPGRVEPTGYFDPVYFPSGSSHSSGSLGPSRLANEVLKEESEPGADDEGENGVRKSFGEDTPSTDTSPTNDEDADDIMRSRDSNWGTNTTCTFSEATSWYNSEESGDEHTENPREFSSLAGSSSRRVNGKPPGSRSVGAETTASGSDAESKSGTTGYGFLSGEKRTISRTHSMSGGTKPLFSGSLQSDSDSEPVTRTTSSGWPAPLGTTLSQQGR